MKAKKFNNFEKLDFKPGSYCILEGSDGKKHPFMVLPCGDNFFPDGRWQEQNIEDENRITLTPSIFCSPQKPCWHGYLTNGKFKTV